MKLFRKIAVAGAAWLALSAVPAWAQERTAVKAGFELPAGSGKTILVFRPTVSVGAQSTGGMFEPNGDWTEQARRNIETALTEQQQRIGNRVVAAPESYGTDAQLVEEYAALFAAVSQSVIDYQFFEDEGDCYCNPFRCVCGSATGVLQSSRRWLGGYSLRNRRAGTSAASARCADASWSGESVSAGAAATGPAASTAAGAHAVPRRLGK